MGLEARGRVADQFEDIREALAQHEDTLGTHPILILDDAEGMRVETLDLVRRLTASALDGEHHVSILLVGTERLMDTLRDPTLAPLRTRFSYAYQLQAFGMEDARNYVRHHLASSGGPEKLFTDAAVTALFSASQGIPPAEPAGASGDGRCGGARRGHDRRTGDEADLEGAPTVRSQRVGGTPAMSVSSACMTVS